MIDDLTDIAGGDPRRASVLRQHLAQLAEAPDARLREMANAVLKGEITLRQAALSDTYGAVLGEAFNPFWSKYQEMTEDERAELVALGRDHIERVRTIQDEAGT